MLTIVYSPDGESISDFEIDEWIDTVVQDASSGEDVEYGVSTSAPIHAIKLAVVEGRLPYKEVEFKHKGQTLTINEYGRIEPWPADFCSTIISLSEKTMRVAIKKREEKENR